MAIEQLRIDGYKGKGNISILYYAHKDAPKGPNQAENILEHGIRILVDQVPSYDRPVNTIYYREDIIAAVRVQIGSWKSQQFGLAQLKSELVDLETKLISK